MAGKKGMIRMSKETVAVLNRIDKGVYGKLLQLKIAKGVGGSMNKFINGILLKEVVENDILLKGYEVDYSEFE